jgi:FAD:protein FMN transferase
LTAGDDARPSVAPGGARAGLHCFAHAAMATTFEVLSAHDDAVYAEQAAHAAFQLADRLEQELSRFIPNSDVSRINDLAAGGSAQVGESTLQCLAAAQALFDATGGAFDVSLGTGLSSLELAPDGFAVRAHKGGVRLDLGGIGKGYAVDLMAELLEEWGIEHALVHGGQSSVVALDPPRGQEGWPLIFRAPEPRDDGVLVRLLARRLAVSASGTRKGEHIFDPSTGRAARRRAVWVSLPIAARPERSSHAWPDSLLQARPATLAEGLSTAFMVLSTDAVQELCTHIPEVEVWLVPASDADTPSGEPLLHVPRRAV